MSIEQYDCETFLAFSPAEVLEVLSDAIKTSGPKTLGNWMEELCDGKTPRYSLVTGILHNIIIPAYRERLKYLKQKTEHNFNDINNINSIQAPAGIRDKQKFLETKKRAYLTNIHATKTECARMKKELGDIFEVTSPVMQSSLQELCYDDASSTASFFEDALDAVKISESSSSTQRTRGEKNDKDKNERNAAINRVIDEAQDKSMTLPAQRVHDILSSAESFHSIIRSGSMFYNSDHLMDLDKQRIIFSNLTMIGFNEYEEICQSTLEKFPSWQPPEIKSKNTTSPQTGGEAEKRRKRKGKKKKGLAETVAEPTSPPPSSATQDTSSETPQSTNQTKQKTEDAATQNAPVDPADSPSLQKKDGESGIRGGNLWIAQGNHSNSYKAAAALNTENIRSYGELEDKIPNILKNPKEAIDIAQTLAHLGIAPNRQSNDNMHRNISPPGASLNATHAEVENNVKLQAWDIAYKICDALFHSKNKTLHRNPLIDGQLRSDAGMRCAKIDGRRAQIKNEDYSEKILERQTQSIRYNPWYYPHRQTYAETLMKYKRFSEAADAIEGLLAVLPQDLNRPGAPTSSELRHFYTLFQRACIGSNNPKQGQCASILAAPEHRFQDLHLLFQRKLPLPIEVRDVEKAHHQASRALPPQPRPTEAGLHR